MLLQVALPASRPLRTPLAVARSHHLRALDRVDSRLCAEYVGAIWPVMSSRDATSRRARYQEGVVMCSLVACSGGHARLVGSLILFYFVVGCVWVIGGEPLSAYAAGVGPIPAPPGPGPSG